MLIGKNTVFPSDLWTNALRNIAIRARNEGKKVQPGPRLTSQT